MDQLDIGKMRHVLTIQSRTVTRDTDGQPINTWTNTTTRRAMIEPNGSTETEVNGKIQAKEKYTITMRYYAFNTTDRLAWGSKVLRITSFSNPDSVKYRTVVQAVEELD